MADGESARPGVTAVLVLHVRSGSGPRPKCRGRVARREHYPSTECRLAISARLPRIGSGRRSSGCSRGHRERSPCWTHCQLGTTGTDSVTVRHEWPYSDSVSPVNTPLSMVHMTGKLTARPVLIPEFPFRPPWIKSSPETTREKIRFSGQEWSSPRSRIIVVEQPGKSEKVVFS